MLFAAVGGLIEVTTSLTGLLLEKQLLLDQVSAALTGA